MKLTRAEEQARANATRPRVLRDNNPIERMLFDRCMKEATYYIDEVSTAAVSPSIKNFFTEVFSRRLQYDKDGWITFDGKKLAHVKDAAP